MPDYLIGLLVSDIAGYNAVSQTLTRAVHFRDVSGAFAMEELKYTTALPLPLPRKPKAEKPNAGASKKVRTRSRQTRP